MRATTSAEGVLDWWQWAACTDEDPDLFFPVGTAGPGGRERERAKQICRRCPVIAECLSWALSLDEPAGIWGGLDEEERVRMRRRARTPARNRA